jgi:hypothetical protein
MKGQVGAGRWVERLMLYGGVGVDVIYPGVAAPKIYR